MPGEPSFRIPRSRDFLRPPEDPEIKQQNESQENLEDQELGLLSGDLRSFSEKNKDHRNAFRSAASQVIGEYNDHQIRINGLTVDHSSVIQYIKNEDSGSGNQEVSQNKTTHTVVTGDTLFGIAQKYGVPIAKIKEANSRSNNFVYKGETLNIPQGKFHTVKRGETLYSISKRYKVNQDKLETKNNISSDNINIGQILEIPQEQTQEENIQTQVIDNEKSSKTKSHIVKRGETLYSISKKHNKSVDDLAKLNNLSKPYIIKIGQKLIIEEKEVDEYAEQKKEISENIQKKINSLKEIGSNIIFEIDENNNKNENFQFTIKNNNNDEISYTLAMNLEDNTLNLTTDAIAFDISNFEIIDDNYLNFVSEVVLMNTDFYDIRDDEDIQNLLHDICHNRDSGYDSNLLDNYFTNNHLRDDLLTREVIADVLNRSK